MVSKALDSSEWSSCEQTPLKDNLVADLDEEKESIARSSYSPTHLYPKLIQNILASRVK